MEDTLPNSCLCGDESLKGEADGFSVSGNSQAESTEIDTVENTVEDGVEDTGASGDVAECRDEQDFRVVGAIQFCLTGESTQHDAGDQKALENTGQNNIAVLQKEEEMSREMGSGEAGRKSNGERKIECVQNRQASETPDMENSADCSGEAGRKSNGERKIECVQNQQASETPDMENSADCSGDYQTIIKKDEVPLEDAALNMLRNLSLRSQDTAEILAKGLQGTCLQKAPGSNETSDQASCMMQAQVRSQAHALTKCSLPHFSVHQTAVDLGLKECCLVVKDFQVSGQTKVNSSSANRKCAATTDADQASRLNSSSSLEPEVFATRMLRSTARRRADSSYVFKKELKKEEDCMPAKDFQAPKRAKLDSYRASRKCAARTDADQASTLNSASSLEPKVYVARMLRSTARRRGDSSCVSKKELKKENCMSVKDFQVSRQTKRDSYRASRKCAAHTDADHASRSNLSSNLEPEVGLPRMTRSTGEKRGDSNFIFQKELKENESCMSLKDFQVSEQLKGESRRAGKNPAENTADQVPTSNPLSHLKSEAGMPYMKNLTVLLEDILQATDSSSVCQKQVKKDCPSHSFPITAIHPQKYTESVLKGCYVLIKDVKPSYTGVYKKGYKFSASLKVSRVKKRVHKTEKLYSNVKLNKKCSVLLRDVASSEFGRKRQLVKPRQSMMKDTQVLHGKNGVAEGENFEKQHDGLQTKAAVEEGQVKDCMKNIGLRQCFVILDRDSVSWAWKQRTGRKQRSSRVYKAKAISKQLWKVDKSWPALKTCFVGLKRMKVEG